MGGDTIAAIATAPGRGGVAVIRISGCDAFAVGEKVAGKLPRPGRFGFRQLAADDVLVLAFKSPRSYTGEDVVEIHSHGGAVVPRQILKLCLEQGARLARRGEFTERAFLNGKMDLSEAESVIELVDAKTDRAAEDARKRLNGEKSLVYRALYETALALSADLEHALDIDEGELPDGFMAAAGARMASLADALMREIRRAETGRMLRDGALVVLAGPPNAGKSSLMNALLGRHRAIVSDIPGTTRDSIEEYLDLDGIPVRLADTAGLRETADEIEREGVRRARDLIAAADYVIDLAGNVHTKCDLGRIEGKLNVSAVTGEGLDELRRDIASHLERSPDPGPTPSEREAALLTEARRALVWHEDPVLCANAARDAARTLGRLTGAEYSADILASIFSRFCVGK